MVYLIDRTKAVFSEADSLYMAVQTRNEHDHPSFPQHIVTLIAEVCRLRSHARLVGMATALCHKQLVSNDRMKNFNGYMIPLSIYTI